MVNNFKQNSHASLLHSNSAQEGCSSLNNYDGSKTEQVMSFSICEISTAKQKEEETEYEQLTYIGSDK